jgi:bile acid:Na+ symporter, BASS family
LKPFLDIGVLGVNILTMAAVGMDLEPQHFRGITLRFPLLLTAVIAQAACLPLIGWLLAKMIGLPPDIGAGILLVAACPIGNIANFYSLLAGVNVPLLVAVSALSVGLSAGTMAVTFEVYGYLLGERFAFAVPTPNLVLKVLLILVLPVLGGMALRHWCPQWSARHSRSVHRAGLVGVAFLLIYVFISQRNQVAAEWQQTTIASGLFVALALAGGLAFGRALQLGSADRLTLGIGFAVRSVALAMAVAITVMNRVEYATFAAVYFLTEIPLLLGVVAAYRWWARMPGALSRLGRVAP